MALTTKVASQFGVPSGLIVVSVQPGSAAARGGILEGDVLEAINGKPVGQGAWTLSRHFTDHKKHVFTVVRGRGKKQVTVENTNE
jgi:S1-C subfamily serine protease